MPDDSIGSSLPTVNWALLPSGIIIDKISGDKKKVKTPSGEYNNIRKFRLLIPKKYFKSGGKNIKNLTTKTILNEQK